MEISKEKKIIIKRYLMFTLGLFFCSLGSAFVEHAGAGASPFTCVSLVMSLTTGVPGGILVWMVIWNAFLLLIQVLILRRSFRRSMLLQIPLAILFMAFYQAGIFLAGRFPLVSYGYSLISIVLGSVIMAFGVTLCYIPGVILNAPESLARVISDRTGMMFANVIIVTELAFVGIAALASILLSGGELIGIREGSLISAVLTGLMANGFINGLKSEIDTLF